MSIKEDTRTLAKWLNEEQTAELDRQALARVLAYLQHSPAAPVQEPAIPEGWERKTVIGFDALVEALDYAERKGFMPDYIADAWEGFNYMADEGGKHDQR